MEWGAGGGRLAAEKGGNRDDSKRRPEGKAPTSKTEKDRPLPISFASTLEGSADCSAADRSSPSATRFPRCRLMVPPGMLPAT